MKPGVVLLVDDDVEFLEELQDALGSSGFTTVAVRDVPAAMAAAREMEPAAIMLDLKLKDGDGFGVARRLKQDPRTAGIPIIMMSGYFSRWDDLEHLYSEEVNLFLSKPVNQQDVVMALRKVLAQGAADRSMPSEAAVIA